MVGHPWMSFLDAFQGYHQIPLSLSYQEKTAFRAPNGNYHYHVMPFGLKNRGSTYQRMVTRMFEAQIRRNMEAYIDDMVVKSKQIEEYLADLGETFLVLREHKLHLNASKCSFGVSSSKFLGYMITHRGIEVNPEQIKAINRLRPPWNPKEVQRLTGMTAALNRFISQTTNKCCPFFQLLQKWKDFQWTEECVTAFEDLKQYLSIHQYFPDLTRRKCCIHTQRSQTTLLASSWSGMRTKFRGPFTMLANPCRRLRCAIFLQKRQCWPQCMPPGNFLITSKPISLWCLLSSLCKPY